MRAQQMWQTLLELNFRHSVPWNQRQKSLMNLVCTKLMKAYPTLQLFQDKGRFTLKSRGRQKKSNFFLWFFQTVRRRSSWVYLLGMFLIMMVVLPSTSMLSASMTNIFDSSTLTAFLFLVGGDLVQQQQLGTMRLEQLWLKLWLMPQCISAGQVRMFSVYLAEMGLEVCSVSQVMTLTQELTTSFTIWFYYQLLGDCYLY